MINMVYRATFSDTSFSGIRFPVPLFAVSLLVIERRDG